MVSYRRVLHSGLILAVAVLLLPLLMVPALLRAQTILTVQITQQVEAPWDKACDSTVTANCIKGWRIYDALADQSGIGEALFDIPVVTPYTGTVTAIGSGPYSSAGGIIGATTVGLDANGGEVESLMVYAIGAARRFPRWFVRP